MKWYFKLNRKIQIAIPFICMIRLCLSLYRRNNFYIGWRNFSHH